MEVTDRDLGSVKVKVQRTSAFATSAFATSAFATTL